MIAPSLSANSLVRLVDPYNAACRSQPLRVTQHGKNIVSLSVDNENTLRIKANGKVDVSGGKFTGPWARLIAEEEEDEDGRSVLRFQSFGHKRRDRALFLTLRSNGELSSSDTAGSFHVVPADEGEEAEPHRAFERPPARRLTDEERSDFVRDGFLILRDAVATEVVDDALRVINHNLGVGANPGKGDFGDLLYASQAYDVARQLLGQFSLPGGRAGGQVALRFPLPPGRAAARRDKGPDWWHIDGMNAHHMSTFQLLVGVALSDQLEDDMGNLIVWRGMHEVTHAALPRLHALRAAAAPPADPNAETGGTADDVWLGQRPSLPPERALQVHLRKGDVVLAHQRTPHSASRNRSPNVRYQVYFRLAAADHRPREALLGGLWDGWRVGGERGECANEEEEEDVEMVAAVAPA